MPQYFTAFLIQAILLLTMSFWKNLPSLSEQIPELGSLHAAGKMLAEWHSREKAERRLHAQLQTQCLGR